MMDVFRCLHLRIAAAFLKNNEMLHRREIREEGVIRNAFPDIPVSWICGEDCARIAVAALLSPEKFADGPAVYPGSPHQYTQTEIADTIGGFIGKSLRYESLSKQVWHDSIVTSSVGDRRVNADMAHHIASVAAALIRCRRSPPMR